MAKSTPVPITKVALKALPLRRVYPKELTTQFADNIIFQFAPAGKPDHFIFSFFQLQHPAILANTEAEAKKEVEKINDIEAKCVARIILTPDVVKDIMEVMDKIFKTFESVKLAK